MTKLIVNPGYVHEQGSYISSLATVDRDDPDTGIAALQHKLTVINDSDMPYVPWGYVDTFITKYIAAYNDALNKRDDIGQLLVKNVATAAERNEFLTGQQFQADPQH